MLRFHFHKWMTDIYVIWIKFQELYKAKVNDIFYFKFSIVMSIKLNYYLHEFHNHIMLFTYDHTTNIMHIS